MKALLRSSLLALVVFASYAAFSAPTTSFGLPGVPIPCANCSK